MNKKSRVVIFGKNGFIAENIISLLNKKKIQNKALSSQNLNLLKKSSIKKIKETIYENDVIIFISAKAPVKNLKMFNENLTMLNNFIAGIDNKKIKHLIYVSSDAVYADSSKKINERSITDPDSLHGIMHLTREKLLETLNIKLTIVRPTLVYGSKDPHNGYGPNKFVRLAKQNSDIVLFGKGEEKRDHIWVNDLAKIIFIIIKKNIYGKINATSGKVFSFFQIAKIIKKTSNKNINIIFTKRSGKMPHNGYRAFQKSRIQNIIPNFKFNQIDIVLKKIYKHY